MNSPLEVSSGAGHDRAGAMLKVQGQKGRKEATIRN